MPRAPIADIAPQGQREAIVHVPIVPREKIAPTSSLPIVVRAPIADTDNVLQIVAPFMDPTAFHFVITGLCLNALLVHAEHMVLKPFHLAGLLVLCVTPQMNECIRLLDWEAHMPLVWHMGFACIDKQQWHQAAYNAHTPYALCVPCTCKGHMLYACCLELDDRVQQQMILNMFERTFD